LPGGAGSLADINNGGDRGWELSDVERFPEYHGEVEFLSSLTWVWVNPDRTTKVVETFCSLREKTGGWLKGKKKKRHANHL